MATPSRRVIYDETQTGRLDTPGEFEPLLRSGQQAHVLPTLPVEMHLYDDRLAILPLHGTDRETVIIVHPSASFEALGDFLEELWQRAVPPSGFPHRTRARPAARRSLAW